MVHVKHDNMKAIFIYVYNLCLHLQLEFPGIEMADIRLTTNNQRNVLNTFWSQSVVDLSRGLDFTPRGPVLARFTHLNHADFTYTIIVNNRNSAPQRGTVRIFIAPKEDERGLPFTFRQQKNLMIEMDKFSVTRMLQQRLISVMFISYLSQIIFTSHLFLYL